MYHFHVKRSSHCCAVYELSGLAPNVIDVGFIDAIKDKAKGEGQPHVLPLLIQFTDAEENGRGRKLRDVLVGEGYRCDEYALGPNPKSGGNHVVLFHWYPHKNKKVSMVREYQYEAKTTNSSQSGVASRGGTLAAGGRTGVGFLGARRRARTGL